MTLDVTETRPVIDTPSVVRTISPAWTVTYKGVAFDSPQLDELPFLYGHVSINRITKVEYRLKTAARTTPWQDAAPDDVFDSVSEGFHFTTPPLPSGIYTVEIRATNTVGAVTPIPYSQQLKIVGSGLTNTRPFGSLTVTPSLAKAGTPITASGAASRDLEAGTLSYRFKWSDSALWTSSSPIASDTHTYSATGPQSVQMIVQDQNGLTQKMERTFFVVGYDTSPVVAFTAQSENRHFTGPSYSLTLSVVGSYDGEKPFAQLQVQFDIDCDGSWDIPASLAKTRNVQLLNPNYPKSERRCVRAGVSDGVNLKSADRFVWAIPYNHQPSLGVTIASGVATASATDPDGAWDGTLEYRWDFNGDGIWDTTFDPSASYVIGNPNTLLVEVKDGLHGRSVWAPCSSAWAC